MQLNNIKEIEGFLATVNQCKGNVYLRSLECDIYNLKSALSQYTAIGALLSEHGDELELFCEEQCDEQLFFKYFEEFPGTLGDGE
jgi:hypothetical protein